ncbi:MAG: hypothetical protein DMG33_02790 [Acidobacteria bacterium]|nr:MAG: hypothetical protein DMG33_02790 [Acidobacteriota bacterium]
MDLTDAQWAILEPVFRPKRRSDWRGRPWRDTRSVLNGVLWILRTGAQWRELPSKYPPYQTCHRRFQSWQQDVPDPLAEENLLSTSGRGIFLMRAFMDEFDVLRGRNGGAEIVMSKRLPGRAQSSHNGEGASRKRGS